MLSEAHRRTERGTDCVVAFVEHHGRPRTEVMLHGLEQVPRREPEYRDTVFTEMDVDAVLARRPRVALVDELAHTDVPGSRNGQKQLLREVRGPSYGKETNYLRAYVAQLRRKLEADPSHPKHFITEPGMGYHFER